MKSGTSFILFIVVLQRLYGGTESGRSGIQRAKDIILRCLSFIKVTQEVVVFFNNTPFLHDYTLKLIKLFYVIFMTLFVLPMVNVPNTQLHRVV